MRGVRCRVPDAFEKVSSAGAGLCLSFKLSILTSSRLRLGGLLHSGLFLFYLTILDSSSNAAGRLCSVHNVVNERLHKEKFDCAHLDDTYDCGCGDEPIGTKSPLELDSEKGMMRGGR